MFGKPADDQDKEENDVSKIFGVVDPEEDKESPANRLPGKLTDAVPTSLSRTHGTEKSRSGPTDSSPSKTNGSYLAPGVPPMDGGRWNQGGEATEPVLSPQDTDSSAATEEPDDLTNSNGAEAPEGGARETVPSPWVAQKPEAEQPPASPPPAGNLVGQMKEAPSVEPQPNLQPGQAMPPQQPGQTMPPQPVQAMPPQPGAMPPQQPGQTMPPQPGQVMPPQPGQAMPPQPGQAMPPQPEQAMPPQPGQQMGYQYPPPGTYGYSQDGQPLPGPPSGYYTPGYAVPPGQPLPPGAPSPQQAFFDQSIEQSNNQLQWERVIHLVEEVLTKVSGQGQAANLIQSVVEKKYGKQIPDRSEWEAFGVEVLSFIPSKPKRKSLTEEFRDLLSRVQ